MLTTSVAVAAFASVDIEGNNCVVAIEIEEL